MNAELYFQTISLPCLRSDADNRFSNCRSPTPPLEPPFDKKELQTRAATSDNFRLSVSSCEYFTVYGCCAWKQIYFGGVYECSHGEGISDALITLSPSQKPAEINQIDPRTLATPSTESFYCSCIFMSVHAPPSRVIDLSILLLSQKQLLFSSQRRFYISQTSNVLRSTLDRSISERRRLLSQ